MTTKLNIAIMAGGNSSEANISLNGAAQIASWLDPERFNVFTVIVKGSDWVLKLSDDSQIHVDKTDFSVYVNSKKIKFDFALIIIHGTPGENGLLQGYFEMLNIPYNTGGVLNTALTFNKYFCKRLVKDTGAHLAKDMLLHRNQPINISCVIEKLGLPIFVKPNESGSSYGVSKVKEEKELQAAIEKAFSEDNSIILEEFIPGKEMSCGVFKGNKQQMILPVTEIIPETEFFDYDAKYLNKSKEITPANISEELKEQIQNLSSTIYDTLQCHGVVRIDYIINQNKIYFLEINTVPGMSEASIVPQQVKAAGGNMRDFFSMIIDDSLMRHRKNR